MADVGDRVRVLSTKAGQVPRDGVVMAVSGRLLRVKWSTGEESSFIPGAGSLAIIGKARKAPGEKTPAPARAEKATKSAAKAQKTAEKATKRSTR